jgi:cytosine/adenosine deaminase-related metal-dependent hydrolase
VGEILIRDIYHLVTLNDAGERFSGVDLLLRDGRIAAIGPKLAAEPPAPGQSRDTVRADTCIALPGLVNTHHHFYQTLQRNLPGVQDAKLFDWLVRLYEIWKHLDPEVVYWSTLLAGAELALTGCTTTSDHHYLFPRQAPADLLDAQFEAAARLGLRLHATRGSMSLGRSGGGLPPDAVVQDEDAIRLDCERVLDRWHDPRPFAMRRVALAPCSPFSVTETLMRDTIQMARRRGVRCHTHLAETEDENRFCLERYGRRPLALMEDLEWLGPDVWFAHGVCFDAAEIDLLARTRTGVAHCPSSNMRLGSGVAPVPAMLQRGVPLGIGVDGSASNDTSDMLGEVRQALLLARVHAGPEALGAEAALRLATRGGARLLGRENEIGSLEPGKAADVVLVDASRLDFAGALSDPLAALVFAGIGHRVHTSIVNGEFVVRDGRLARLEESEIASRAHALSFRMLRQAGQPLPWGLPPWLAT